VSEEIVMAIPTPAFAGLLFCWLATEAQGPGGAGGRRSRGAEEQGEPTRLAAPPLLCSSAPLLAHVGVDLRC
jgi:hypothetical protein